MFKFDGWMMPSGETHLPDNMTKTNRVIRGRLSYQYSKYEAAKKYVKQWRTAVDVGAHVGLWAYHMGWDFANLHCIEPMPEHIECLKENLYQQSYKLHPYAVGAEFGSVSLASHAGESSGDMQVVGLGNIKMVTVDSLGISDVDFMKIDCEGYELNVLTGAIETVAKYKPCIIVEQKRDMAVKYDGGKLGAVKFLQSMGAVLREEISGDYILSWD